MRYGVISQRSEETLEVNTSRLRVLQAGLHFRSPRCSVYILQKRYSVSSGALVDNSTRSLLEAL